MQGSAVGRLHTATVRLVEKGLGAAWHLARIEVLNIAEKSTAVFLYNDWLQQTKANPTATVTLTAQPQPGQGSPLQAAAAEPPVVSEAAQQGAAEGQGASAAGAADTSVAKDAAALLPAGAMAASDTTRAPPPAAAMVPTPSIAAAAEAAAGVSRSPTEQQLQLQQQQQGQHQVNDNSSSSRSRLCFLLCSNSSPKQQKVLVWHSKAGSRTSIKGVSHNSHSSSSSFSRRQNSHRGSKAAGELFACMGILLKLCSGHVMLHKVLCGRGKQGTWSADTNSVLHRTVFSFNGIRLLWQTQSVTVHDG